MKKVLIAMGMAVLVVATSATGCSSSGFSCDAKSKCPNDPPPTQSQIDKCKAEQMGKCAAQYNDLGTCTLNQQKCGADGKTDSTAALQALGNCANQIKAYQDCKMANP
jgi:hypothetical protein